MNYLTQGNTLNTDAHAS